VIPESEWKFFEGTEQRIKHLATHREENRLALYRGEAPPWDPQELAAREAAVVQEFEYPARVEAAFSLDPTPRQRRHLELHRSWTLGAMFRTHPDLASLEAALLERELAFRPRVRGREASRAEIEAILIGAEDRELREAAHDALAPLGEEVEEDLIELFRRREMLARALLQIGYPEVILAAREQDRGEVVGLLDAFERYTRLAYEQTRVDVATHLGLHELEPWDLAYGLHRMAEGTGSGDADETWNAARAQAARWGFAAEAIPSLEHARWVPEPTVLPRDVPEDVPVVLAPGPGADVRAIAAAFGRALACRSVETRRHLLELENPVVLEASGWLISSMLIDAGGDDSEERTRRTAIRRLHLLELRRLTTLSVFENLVYARSEIEPGRLYGDVVEHALHESGRSRRSWPTELSLMADPFVGISRILGAMVGAQIAERLETLFPDGRGDTGVGTWLREELFAEGAARPWREKVASATGVALDMEALSRWLGIEYTGPELGDEEGVRDPRVEEYFRDLDLDDLELD